MNRREFIWKSALTSTAAFGLAAELNAQAKHNFKLGYSAITWNGNDLQAIKEISELGFKGIQLRANTYAPFKDKAQELKDILEKNHLQLAMFSSGNVSIQDDISKDIETHLNHARFIKALGGKSLQITNNARPKDRLPTSDELKKFAKNISEVAKRVVEETGIQPAYHNHMHQLGETPQEVEIILSEMNTKFIKLELDVAHYKQGGGNPADAILKYKDILYATHIKDTCPSNEASGYKFCELGQGRVDFKSVFENLQKIKFNGWNIIELDAVPVKDRTPMESAKISKAFLETLNIKL